jgi:DUF4097 and DUF4098 domain-containing protein YvlB
VPTFDTPEPISVTIDVGLGDIRIVASDRTDTTVDVRPTDPGHDLDVRAAEQTRVEYVAGRLLVKTARQRRLFGRPGSVDVTIELPVDSQVQGDTGAGAVRGTGRLGECRVKTGAGDIHLADTGPAELSSGVGAVTVEHVGGTVEVSTGSGRIRVRAVAGTAVVKNSNGDCWVGEVSGDVRVNTANGDITVDRAHASVTASTANGDIRIGEVARGSASLRTGFGAIETGIRRGTAALLDVHTHFGTVHNRLDATERPAPSDETVEVRARTSYGDITVRRSERTAS